MKTAWNQGVHVVGLVAVAFVAVVVTAGPALAGGAERDTEVTFAKDVAPILQRSCENCHRPGGGAPMSLVSYSDVRPWARSIKNRTMAGEMPPWSSTRTSGSSISRTTRR